MTDSRDLVAVDVGNGLIVWHTREEYDRLWAGVDREATAAMTAEIQLEHDPTKESL